MYMLSMHAWLKYDLEVEHFYFYFYVPFVFCDTPGGYIYSPDWHCDER